MGGGLLGQSAVRISGGLSGCSCVCADGAAVERLLYLKVVKEHAPCTGGHFNAPLSQEKVLTHQTFCVGEIKVVSRGHRLNV